ncbi:MAG: aspartate kinase [Cryomorphaceae bacterium]|nr:MAG: aspartate kinase [Cryomorphaceae bacterium]
MQVFKFGGASVKDAEAVRNVLRVLQSQPADKLVIVVSAMGKTTNALEKVWNFREEGKTEDALAQMEESVEFHNDIAAELFPGDDSVHERVARIWSELRERVQTRPAENRDFSYDQIVSNGELVSTTIVSAWLNLQGFGNTWLDARKLICTDSVYREAGVNWNNSTQAINHAWTHVQPHPNGKVAVTQGFIGCDSHGYTTTLGREGSDYTAAILAFALQADSVTIWKDVPGMLNADPKFFENTQRLARISYKEAIELSYYGASVIHPKTIKPLQNADILLYVRSFLEPTSPGTEIQSTTTDDALIPSYIFKDDQVLISISPRDFSFIVEENLSHLFGLLARERIRVNLMQNSALSFSVCANRDPHRIQRLLSALEHDYMVRYNEPVTLITIRHYTEPVIRELLAGKEILVEQRSRSTARYVVRN